MPAYTNETGFPVLIIDTDGKAQEIADDGTFNSYFYYPDCTMSAVSPNPTLKELPGGCTLEFTLTGKADDSVDDVAFPAPVMAKILGHKLCEIEAIPGEDAAEPTGAFAVSVNNSRGAVLATKADCSASILTQFEAATALDRKPLVDDTLTLTCGDIGEDNTVKVIVKTEA